MSWRDGMAAKKRTKKIKDPKFLVVAGAVAIGAYLLRGKSESASALAFNVAGAVARAYGR